MRINPTSYVMTDDVGRRVIEALCRVNGIRPRDVAAVTIGKTSVTFEVLQRTERGGTTKDGASGEPAAADVTVEFTEGAA